MAPDADDRHEPDQHDRQQQRPGNVDRRTRVVARMIDEHRPDHAGRHQPQRQVDVKHPAPVQLLHKKAADQRAQHRRQTDDRAEKTLVTRAFARRHDIGDRGHGRHRQAAPAQPLHRPKRNQLGHRMTKAAQRGPEQKQPDPALQHDLAPEQIAQLAIDRRDDRLRQHVAGHDPRQMRQPAEFADNGRQRGGHHRLIERSQKHDKQQRPDNQAKLR